MPIDIRDGVRIEYVKTGVSLPKTLNTELDRYRTIHDTKGRIDRSAVVAAALEFYLAAKGELPADYPLSPESERAKLAMAAYRKAERTKKKKGGR